MVDLAQAIVMAESKSVTIVPLNDTNYPTWKVQCRMALMKDGLWNIVNGTEEPPARTDTERFAKFVACRDRALAIIVLSIGTTLLYLIGEPEDPITVWKTLPEQFQKKTWANKLELRRKLYSQRLREGDSVQELTKTMTEIFDSLSVIDDPVSDEDRASCICWLVCRSHTMSWLQLLRRIQRCPSWKLSLNVFYMKNENSKREHALAAVAIKQCSHIGLRKGDRGVITAENSDTSSETATRVK